jgi:hypothetical protein
MRYVGINKMRAMAGMRIVGYVKESWVVHDCGA